MAAAPALALLPVQMQEPAATAAPKKAAAVAEQEPAAVTVAARTARACLLTAREAAAAAGPQLSGPKALCQLPALAVLGWMCTEPLEQYARRSASARALAKLVPIQVGMVPVPVRERCQPTPLAFATAESHSEKRTAAAAKAVELPLFAAQAATDCEPLEAVESDSFATHLAQLATRQVSCL